MAPHSSGPWHMELYGEILLRSVSNQSITVPVISDDESNALQCLALTFAAVSVASSVLAFYWFIKMRRSFRHDLIMLLIQSDMFKALWLMVYPIVVFTHGPVHSDSTFCQVSGFFLAVGIESSDIAVLMIAVHSALYIFLPKASSREGGLHPYRHIAYFIWLLFPIMMASLAFVNDSNAYVAEGTYCYLPVRPFWYRLALAWIPRYIIFLVILSIYASIYYYVRYKQNGFNEAERLASKVSTIHQGKRIKRNTIPPTPPLAHHGLIPEAREDFTSPTGEDEPPLTVPPEARKTSRSKSTAGVHRFMLASMVAAKADSLTPSDSSILDTDSFMGPSTPQPVPAYASSATRESDASVTSTTPSNSRATSWQDPFVSRFSPRSSGPSSKKQSVIDIFTILRRHPDSTSAPTPISQLQLTNSQGQTFPEAEMLRTRDKIQKQLRFLFIYPLVYIGMWIVPFAYHVIQYDDRFAVYPPFGLSCVATIFVCLQGAIDCWLFSTREKPWKHIPGAKGGFWESLKFWTGWTGYGERRITHGPGRTREEMVREARAAYRRRDDELAQRRTETESPSRVTEQQYRRGERSWWDVDGAEDTGSMSPLTEEVDPLTAASDSDEVSPSRPATTEPGKTDSDHQRGTRK